MSSAKIKLCVDAAAVADATAEFVIEVALHAVKERGVFHWCATGGSTPAALYAALREPTRSARMPWEKSSIWFGDDRYVPRTDPLSNLASIDAVLLADHAGALSPLHGARVHPWPTNVPSPDDAVSAYLHELYAAGVPTAASGYPTFDLVMIGIGGDGHCLSVFPGSPLSLPEAPIAAGVPAPTHIEPHVPRLSFSLGLLSAARAVCAVVVGSSKSVMLDKIMHGSEGVHELPAKAALIPTATWIVDQAAAANLQRE
ncbi:MAG: 6-phosphogluconolactonase [Chloroflexota bacterium]